MPDYLRYTPAQVSPIERQLAVELLESAVRSGDASSFLRIAHLLQVNRGDGHLCTVSFDALDGLEVESQRDFIQYIEREMKRFVQHQGVFWASLDSAEAVFI